MYATSYTTAVSNISFYIEDIGRSVSLQKLGNQINFVLDEYVEQCCNGYFEATNNTKDFDGNSLATSKFLESENIQNLQNIEETLEANFMNAENSLKQWRRGHYYDKVRPIDTQANQKNSEIENKDVVEKKEDNSTYELACQRIRETSNVRNEQTQVANNRNVSVAQNEWNSCFVKKKNGHERDEKIQEIHNLNVQVEQKNPKLSDQENLSFKQQVHQKQLIQVQNNTQSDQCQQKCNKGHKIQHYVNVPQQRRSQPEQKYPIEQLQDISSIANQTHLLNSEEDEYHRQKQETERWQEQHFNQINQIRRQQEEVTEAKKGLNQQQYQACQEQISQIQRKQAYLKTQQRHSQNYSNPINPEPPNSVEENIVFIRRNLLLKWALQAPSFQNLRSIDQLLSSIELVFSSTIGVPSHKFFSKFKSISYQDLIENNTISEEKLKRAVRKIRLLLHPDRLPKDLSKEQMFLCRFLWDIISDALESYHS